MIRARPTRAATGPDKPSARARWGWTALAVTVALGALWLIAGRLSPATPSTPARSSPAETARCIRDPRCHRTFVVAHRAEGFGGPENSRAAVALVVEAGVPVIEIDLRASRDGRLFLMHDGPLERYTSLRGRVEEVSSEEIGRARLKNGERIPRFEDVYAITRGRAMLSVDFKVHERMIEEVADWIHAHGSFDDLIFFANTGEEMEAAARAKQRYPRMIVMVRLLDTRVTVDSTRAVFGGRLPEILHTDRIGVTEVARLRALGTKVYMNAVPLDRYFEPFRYFATRSLLETGLDFVLTGNPLSVMRKVAAAQPAR
jgi:glycerophosphoryl diester phosphodiesterase